MQALKTYIDRAIDGGIVRNDADLAHRLGVAPSTVCRWRDGSRHPDEDQAAALAALLGKPEILAECMGARAKKPENRRMWERAANALRMTAALGVVGGVVLYTTAPALPAAPVLASAVAVSALCEVLRRRRERRQQRLKPHVGPLRRWSDQYGTERVQHERIDARRQQAQTLATDAPLPCANARA